MQTNTTYNAPHSGQQRGISAYKDPGSHGRDDYTAEHGPVTVPSPARSESHLLPQSTPSAPTIGGSAYQSLNAVHLKETTDGEDFYRIGPNVEVEYDEVFREPSSHGRFFSVAAINRLVFTYTKIAVYILFSIVLGILLTFIWAILFAVLNFLTVYTLQPLAKCTFVWLRFFASLARGFTRSCLDPLYESVALVFSRIKGGFSLKASGFLPIGANTECASIQEIQHL